MCLFSDDQMHKNSGDCMNSQQQPTVSKKKTVTNCNGPKKGCASCVDKPQQKHFLNNNSGKLPGQQLNKEHTQDKYFFCTANFW